METLGKNWFIENLVDFEYKKYVLLSYLQQVEQSFTKQKLYPHLADLVTHYRNLTDFTEGKKLMFEQFPGYISQVDMKDFRIAYEKVVQDDELMNEIEQIVQYAKPLLKKSLDTGKSIYEFVEQHVSVYPVGLLPLYKNEGYFLLKETNRETRVYEYQVTLFEGQHEQYRGIHTRFITSYVHSFANTFESIKRELITQHKKLPNPATYAFVTDRPFPLQETIEPVVKRLLVKYIKEGEG